MENRFETEKFITQKFNEYYRENLQRIQPPNSIEKREFGFFLSKEKIMVRHKGFRNANELKEFIKLMAPSHIYHSSAYYERPEEAMDKKGWLGADLIFDLDADHMPTPCKLDHDYWICDSCGTYGRGKIPEKCARCGAKRFTKEKWLCETCMEVAKAETLKLLDFLTADFGLKEEDIDVFFSGHRGYHIHVEKEDLRNLDQLARKEITDYIIGTGLKPIYHGLLERQYRRQKEFVGPDLKDPGWRGRLARGIYDFVASATLQQLEEIEGIKKKIADDIIINREQILKRWENKPQLNMVKGIDALTWDKIAKYAVQRQSAAIDTVVTTDIHRLVRMPMTLHGKTGLLKLSIPLRELESFDPFKDAVAFKEGQLRVCVDEVDRFRLGKIEYGPYKQQTVDLPMAAAMLLLCKRVAFLAGPTKNSN